MVSPSRRCWRWSARPGREVSRPLCCSWDTIIRCYSMVRSACSRTPRRQGPMGSSWSTCRLKRQCDSGISVPKRGEFSSFFFPFFPPGDLRSKIIGLRLHLIQAVLHPACCACHIRLPHEIALQHRRFVHLRRLADGCHRCDWNPELRPSGVSVSGARLLGQRPRRSGLWCEHP